MLSEIGITFITASILASLFLVYYSLTEIKIKNNIISKKFFIYLPYKVYLQF